MSIRKRTNKIGKPSFQVTIRIKGHETMTETFTAKEDATKWEHAMTTATKDSVYSMPDTKGYRSTSIKTASENYQASGKCTKTVKANLNVIEREIGDSLLGGITKIFVADYIKAMLITNSQYGRFYKPASIVKQIQALRNIVKFQAESMRVEPPLSVITSEALGDDWDDERKRILTKSEEELIRNKLRTCEYGKHWSLMLDIALETGARQAEIILADRTEFDLNEKVWIIPAAHTKSKVERQIPLSIKALSCANQLVALFDEETVRRASLPEPQESIYRIFWVFSTPSSVCTGFKKHIDSLKIIDLRFHDLRHTAITRMVLTKRKLSIFEIMKISGHTTIKMLNRYANIRGGDLVKRME